MSAQATMWRAHLRAQPQSGMPIYTPVTAFLPPRVPVLRFVKPSTMYRRGPLRPSTPAASSPDGSTGSTQDNNKRKRGCKPHTGRTPAAADVQEWWRKLPRAQLEVHQLKSGLDVAFLRLVDGTYFPQLMTSEFPLDALMRHPSYAHTHRIIQECCTKEGRRSFLVVGTPGVGKSIYLYELLYELACQSTTVVWDSIGAKQAYLLTPSGVYMGNIRDFAAELASPDTWYLCDSVAPELPGTVKAVTVVASSPCMDGLNEFMKRRLKQLWLDTWEEEELQLCAEHLRTGIQPAEVQSLYAMWGGSARYVLDNRGTWGEAEWRQVSCYAKLPLLRVFACNIIDAPVVSHKILHVRADRSTCTKSQLVFASKAMAQAVPQQLRQHDIDELYSFIRWAAGIPQWSVLRGLALQAAVIPLQQKGGVCEVRSAAFPDLPSVTATLMPTMRAYPAVDGIMVVPVNTFNLPSEYHPVRPAMAPPALQPGSPNTSAGQQQEQQQQPQQELQPAAAVEYQMVLGVEQGALPEEVDTSGPGPAAAAAAAEKKRGRPRKQVQALAPPAAYPKAFTKDVLLCQVTADEEHPISVRGVNSLLRELPADIRVVGLAFWVPPDLFNKYEAQPFEVSKDNMIAPHIDQYVVKVPVPGLSTDQEW